MNRIEQRHTGRRLNLGVRIGLIAGIFSFSISVLISVLVGTQTAERIKARQAFVLQGLAYQMANALDYGLHERYKDIQLLAGLQEIRTAKTLAASKRALLDKFQSIYPELAWVGITDANGTVLSATGGLLEGADVSTRPWFKEGLKAPWIGDVHDAVLLAKLLPNKDGEPMRFVDITAPILDADGKTIGVLGAHLSWSWAKSVSESVMANVSSIGFVETIIASRSGGLLLGPAGAEEEARDWVRTIENAGKQIETGIDFAAVAKNGEEYLIGAARTGTKSTHPSLDWSIMIRQTSEVAKAPALRQQSRILLLGGCLGLFFGIIAGLIGSRFVKPFGDLAQAARRFKEGKNPAWPTFQSNDEAADLSFALRDLLQSIEEQKRQLLRFNENLQSKIEERTEALLIANQRLTTSESQVRSIMQTALDAIIATDHLGNVISWNKGAVVAFGYSEDEMIGRSLSIIVPERFREAHERGMKRVAETGVSKFAGQRMELVAIRKDGTEFDVELSLASWLNGENNFFTAVVRDITERKRTEKALIYAREQAESAAAAKAQFLAQMSHEIRTPLNGVIGMTQMLIDTKLNEEQADYARTVLDSSEGLLAIINDVLDFSKVEAGKMDLEEVPFNPAQLLSETEKAFGVAVAKKRIKLESEWTSQAPRALRGDPGRLRQVLTNLIGNAIKFTSKGGVSIKASHHLQSANRALMRFEITDTGIGIPKEALARMFQAFSQADSSMSRKYGGTGLGLSICKKLVTLMGGEIGVKSEEGVGSTFWFQVPLVLEAAAAQDRPQETTEIGKASRPARILVAEDNPVNLQIALAMLKKAGYKPQGVGNGNEVLDALRSSTFDLILMDCQMPELDGFETTRIIRRSESLGQQRLPIIAMTANAVQGSEEECLAAGMNAYVSKPVKPVDLTRTIEKHLPTPDSTGAA